MLNSNFYKEGGNLYFGNVKNGKADGFGVYNYNSGNRYIGSFKNGLFNGHGIFIYKDEDRFEGEYLNGKQNGHGIFIYKDGDRFEGEYLNGKRNGFGIYIHKNGDRFEGEYLNGERNGFGISVFQSIYRFEGNYLNSAWNGPCMIEFANGDRFVGTANDGHITHGIYYYKSGSFFKGSFVGKQRMEGFSWVNGRVFKQRFEGKKIVENKEVRGITMFDLLHDSSRDKLLENKSFHSLQTKNNKLQKENNTLVQLLEEKKNEKECRQCSICTINKVNCILSCGHFLFCVNCVKKVIDCPMCRAKITSHTRFYD